MALPRTHQSSFTPGEIEFVAGDELISIIPKMKMPRMTYIKTEIGPFQPPLPVKVPVWIALIMKKNNKCTIICPEWLTIENLKKRHEEEEKGEEFSALPFHYMELAQMLLETASDDIVNAEQIRKILKDLRETRQAKARLGVKLLDGTWFGIDNLSIMEINEIRPFFTRANYEMSKLNHAEAEAATRAEDDEDTQYDEPSQNY